MDIFDPGAKWDDEEPEEPIASDLREAEPAGGRLDSNSHAARRTLARRFPRGNRAWRLYGTLGWLLLVVSLVIGLSGGFDGIARNVAQALRCLSARPTLSPTSSHPPITASSIRILGHGSVGRDTQTMNTGGAGVLATPSPPGVVSVAPSQNAMRYPLASTWSPDGQTLAILGSFIAPDSAGEPSSLVELYDVATGRLIQALSPGAILLNAAMQDPDTLRPVLLATACASGSATTTYVLGFSQIFWAAQYGRIALPFFLTPVEGSASQQAQQLYAGLLDMYEDGSYAWAMLQPASQNIFSPNISLRWDLTARVMTVIPTPTPALGYHWSADDTLVIDTPLGAQSPSSATALGPVADPGGAQVSIWQSGTVDYVTRPINSNSRQLISPGAYLYQAGGFGPGFAAWSPDGRYIVDPVATSTGRFEPTGIPAPSAQDLIDLGVAGMPLLPIRDIALQEALAALANQSPDTYPEMLLAWRPDGRVLAAQLAATYGNPAQHIVILYDCATGRQLATLTPPAPSATPQKDPSYLSWSPDGMQLLAFDGVSDEGTLWGSGDLP